MNRRTHILKQIRTGAEVTQQDVAFLLNMDTGSLARYENEKRIPTPEILLLYHILFGIPISDLLAPQLKRVKQNLISRSELLHTQRDSRHTPKSVHSIAYIRAIVNNIKQTKTYDV
ncbi:MAG: helix-turn-helix domain-containing protein [Xanthomarina gelatinilytica]|uniref:helix-turn-helix domain-containing protein n=1 Tax=Xanthomarina gelatinilytica TaxID=1137281 RepID=UPI003A8619BE